MLSLRSSKAGHFLERGISEIKNDGKENILTINENKNKEEGNKNVNSIINNKERKSIETQEETNVQLNNVKIKDIIENSDKKDISKEIIKESISQEQTIEIKNNKIEGKDQQMINNNKKEEENIKQVENLENVKSSISSNMNADKGENFDLEFDFDVDDDTFEKELNKKIDKLNEKISTFENKEVKENIALEKQINEDIQFKNKSKEISINKSNDLNNLNKNTSENEKTKEIKNIIDNNDNKNQINDNIKKASKTQKLETNEKNKIIQKNGPKLSLPFFANQNDKEIYIDSAIKKLLSPYTLLEGELTTLMDILYQTNSETRKHFSFNFLLNLRKKYSNNKVIFLQNYRNFEIFAKIFINLINKEERKYTLGLIIEISELIKINNCFLYKIIRNKNQMFKEIAFWKSLIEQLFINSLNDQAMILKEKENKKKSLPLKKKEPDKTPFWKRLTADSFINAINDMTNNLAIKDEVREMEREKGYIYLLEMNGFSRYINDYKRLSHQIKNDLEIFGKKSLDKILCKNIVHMSNFNVNPDSTKVLILNFCAQFGFGNELKEYYINLIDSYDSKNYLLKKKKISLKDKNKKDLIVILSNCFIFLPVKERIKILLMQKKLNSQGLKAIIFRKILRKTNLSLNNRILIWENILKINLLKKQYNYSEIKKNSLERIAKGELQKGTKLFKNNETIDKDVNRTIFIKNNSEYQEKLKFVLRSLYLFFSSIGYYQGMNYIGAFLLQILNGDEEKTFYFMLSLEKETKYKELFKDNLQLLNDSFKIVEKMLEIGLPEAYYHLSNNRILANYYAPSWFLTIFWCVSPIFEIEKIPKFSVMVFEKFIFDGWDAIFNGGITAIQYYSRELLNVHEDMIMNYLITEFCNKEIFKNKDFENVEKQYTNNSGFINKEFIDLLKKICSYEEQNKNEE